MNVPLADTLDVDGVRYFRLTEWRAVDDGAARATRGRFRNSLEPQGVRTLERAVEIPGLKPNTTRVVVALFRDGEEASGASTARTRASRARTGGCATSSPTPEVCVDVEHKGSALIGSWDVKA